VSQPQDAAVFRFLGRKAYIGAAVVLFSAMRRGGPPLASFPSSWL
jgi:hypothetical protein